MTRSAKNIFSNSVLSPRNSNPDALHQLNTGSNSCARLTQERGARRKTLIGENAPRDALRRCVLTGGAFDFERQGVADAIDAVPILDIEVGMQGRGRIKRQWVVEIGQHH